MGKSQVNYRQHFLIVDNKEQKKMWVKYRVKFLHCVLPPCLKIYFLFLARFAIKSTKCKFFELLLLINLKADKMEMYINYIIIINTV